MVTPAAVPPVPASAYPKIGLGPLFSSHMPMSKLRWPAFNTVPPKVAVAPVVVVPALVVKTRCVASVTDEIWHVVGVFPVKQAAVVIVIGSPAFRPSDVKDVPAVAVTFGLAALILTVAVAGVMISTSPP